MTEEERHKLWLALMILSGNQTNSWDREDLLLLGFRQEPPERHLREVAVGILYELICRALTGAAGSP